jgi:hypothetical protein
MNKLPNVTMNDGRPVRTTIRPFKAPMPPQTVKENIRDNQIGHPQKTEGMAISIPAKPIMEPTERSNSPAIISKATGAARMPS